MKKKKYYYGKILIVGFQNSGKSTLLNKIIGKKISITSKKKNTTQENIIGIKKKKKIQFIYIDTPGFNIKKNISENIIKKIINFENHIFKKIKFVILIFSQKNWNNKNNILINFFKKIKICIIIVLNKIDKIKNKNFLLPIIDYLYKSFKIKKIIPISSKTGENINVLEKIITKKILKKKNISKKNKKYNSSLKFKIHECVREKIMRYFGDELPYTTKIKIKKIKKNVKKEKIIHVYIYVKNNRQKKIIIGKKGKKIRLCSIISRQDLEKNLKNKIHLFLWVKKIKKSKK
ncbi:MAG: GTPase Era [Buchnera aphidicola (Periphyllus acericola)]|uniref:GTPase Era n=1 Tax=Buchnera aphidicola TaxID=9 RepID=UPI0030D2FC27|nr:GTPase Era [Buchnera aphidicola (Periphyllus acericola)]